MRIFYLSEIAKRQAADTAWATWKTLYKACRSNPSETLRQDAQTAYTAFQVAALAAGPDWQPINAQ